MDGCEPDLLRWRNIPIELVADHESNVRCTERTAHLLKETYILVAGANIFEIICETVMLDILQGGVAFSFGQYDHTTLRRHKLRESISHAWA